MTTLGKICFYIVISLAFLFSACSKEHIIDDEINIVDLSEVPADSPVVQYIRAQGAMLQLFTTLTTEVIKASLPVPLAVVCPDTTNFDNGPGLDRGLIMDFGTGCTVDNGHTVAGKATLSTFAPTLFSTFDTLPAFLSFENDTIIINDYSFIIHKPDTSMGFDIKFFQTGTMANPNFEFRIGFPVYFELINPDGEKTEITVPWSSAPFLQIKTTGTIDLNFGNLYNATYEVKFEADLNSPPIDNLWKVKTYNVNCDSTDEFRVITAANENLIIQPTYAWPLNGTVQCWSKPDNMNNIFPVLQYDLDFGSDNVGCNLGQEDVYIEVCTYANENTDCSNTDCDIWEFNF